MKYWLRCSIIAILGVTASARNAASQPADPNATHVMTLVLQPARIDASKKYSLLPSAAERKEGDAGVIYKQAVEALPKDLAANQREEWQSLLSFNRFPLDKAKALVQQARASLQLVAEGAAYRDCSWIPQETEPIRDMGMLFCMKAHLEVAQQRYDETIASIRTSLAMCKHIGDNGRVIQGLVSVAMTAATLRRIEELAQAPNAPNLLPALKALPVPLIDIEAKIHSELDGDNEENAQRARQIVQRLGGTVAGLECIEALRHYAATHNRQLPAKLSDISDVQLSDDPATGKPFAYRLEGSKAILEVSPPKGGTPREGMRYEITIAP
jgi:hypothetical protein